LAATYGPLLERHWTESSITRLALDLGPEGPVRLRVATLSDFHYDPLCEGEYLERVVAETNALRPDLILLLGDFISEEPGVAPEAAAILGRLSAPLGVRAVLGNHDVKRGERTLRGALANHGIDVLVNRLVRLPVPSADGTLVLAGLDTAFAGRPRPSALPRLRTGERLLLAQHEPDLIDRNPAPMRERIALQVSGHTHGGQICAPGGVVLRRARFGERFTRGHYVPWPGAHLYVTRGIGTLGIHARTFCRPEITCLDLSNTARLPA
jgi:predicted MPP superfamily phosphohydrolase